MKKLQKFGAAYVDFNDVVAFVVNDQRDLFDADDSDDHVRVEILLPGSTISDLLVSNAELDALKDHFGIFE